MKDVLDIVKNIEYIYDSNTAFQVLKDFERVLDELDIYVYKNWGDGELCEGPVMERHWITCSFMWPRDKMPDPMGGKRLLDYDCNVFYSKEDLVQPKKIESPDDFRPGTRRGKLERIPVWVVKIEMPKQLIMDMYQGFAENNVADPAVTNAPQGEPQEADVAAAEATPAPEEGAV
jgi:hypothetical protein